MKKKPIEDTFENSSRAPELPTPEIKRLVQAEVSKDLFEAVYAEIKRRNLKIKQVLEFGLKYFLVRSNKEEADRLGIKTVETHERVA